MKRLRSIGPSHAADAPRLTAFPVAPGPATSGMRKFFLIGGYFGRKAGFYRYTASDVHAKVLKLGTYLKGAVSLLFKPLFP